MNEDSCREAVRGFAGRPERDQDLCGLVARCLALIPENRPRLAILLRQVSDFYASRTADFYAGTPTAHLETDQHIQMLTQTYMLNGPAT